MKFTAALLSAAASVNAMELDTNVDIPATSRLGSRILSKARMLEGNNDQSYTSWVAGYSIKFDRCVSSQNYYGGYFAGNDGQYNYDVSVFSFRAFVSYFTELSSDVSSFFQNRTLCRPTLNGRMGSSK